MFTVPHDFYGLFIHLFYYLFIVSQSNTNLILINYIQFERSKFILHFFNKKKNCRNGVDGR